MEPANQLKGESKHYKRCKEAAKKYLINQTKKQTWDCELMALQSHEALQTTHYMHTNIQVFWEYPL